MTLAGVRDAVDGTDWSRLSDAFAGVSAYTLRLPATVRCANSVVCAHMV